MEKAIALGEYQYQVRTKHRPALGANDAAMIEDSIRLTLAHGLLRAWALRSLSQVRQPKVWIVSLQESDRFDEDEGYIDEGQKTGNKIKGRKGSVVFLVEEE